MIIRILILAFFVLAVLATISCFVGAKNEKNDKFIIVAFWLGVVAAVIAAITLIMSCITFL